MPVPGSVMVPGFRRVRPDGRTFVLDIVGYWPPEYLRKRFAQVARSGRDNILGTGKELRPPDQARPGVMSTLPPLMLLS